jgi:hypothetical protein
MKFYESHYEEYIQSMENYNIHPELDIIHKNLPDNIADMGNLIVYGPSGVGKYTQVLKIIKKYSPSNLKYDKKIKIDTDKNSYVYRISDIHYEIDMALLGCNSKIIWHEVFLQIIDIVSVKNDKKGIILCKNFHMIHTELLEIFYSYIQQYNHPQSTIQIRFIISSEHVSFLPNNILQCCKIVSIRRPSKEQYTKMHENKLHTSHIVEKHKTTDTLAFMQRISKLKMYEDNYNKIHNILSDLDTQNIINIKEIKSFSLFDKEEDIPNDIFNIICNNIIREITYHKKIVFTDFRDIIYDILIYNLDFTECFWYILNHFIKNGELTAKKTTNVLKKTHLFLKYYNNNYRPIYHLESIFFYIIIQLYYT